MFNFVRAFAKFLISYVQFGSCWRTAQDTYDYVYFVCGEDIRVEVEYENVIGSGLMNGVVYINI